MRLVTIGTSNVLHVKIFRIYFQRGITHAQNFSSMNKQILTDTCARDGPKIIKEHHSDIDKKLQRSPNFYDPNSVQRLGHLAKPFLNSLYSREKLSPALAYGLTLKDLRVGETNENQEHKIKQNHDNNETEMESIPKDPLATIMSLDYASGQERIAANVRKAIDAFSRRENDTGSPEVQIAIWTTRIMAMKEHVRLYSKDQPTIRRIQLLEVRRRKMIKYLHRISLPRFFACLDRLGIPHDILERHSQKYPRHFFPNEMKAERDAAKAKEERRKKR